MAVFCTKIGVIQNLKNSSIDEFPQKTATLNNWQRLIDKKIIWRKISKYFFSKIL